MKQTLLSKVFELQLRNDDAVLTVGVPHEVVLEREDGNEQTTTVVHEDVGNEDFLSFLEEKESRVATLSEFVAMHATELINLLAGRETQPVRIAQAFEDLGECPVYYHLVDGKNRVAKLDGLLRKQSAEIHRRRFFCHRDWFIDDGLEYIRDLFSVAGSVHDHLTDHDPEFPESFVRIHFRSSRIF